MAANSKGVAESYTSTHAIMTQAARFEWTEERKDKLRELTLNGCTSGQAAEQLGCSADAVSGAKSRYSIRNVKKEANVRKTFSEILDFPPAPFAVKIPDLGKPSLKTGETIRAVVYSDTHFPFQDDRVLNLVKYVIKDVKPHYVVHLGDLIDCWQISRFDKDPTRLDTLQDNIDAARTHLHEVSQIAPKAQKFLLEGNHEQRLTRTVWGLDGAQRQFATLRKFQQAMTWPSLLGLEDIGWTWVPERKQSRTPILPKIITKHGTLVSKWSGATAKAEWTKYGASGISGHTHRAGQFMHRDHNGMASWIECGCTCDLDPEYGFDMDWQQAFTVLTWSSNHVIMSSQQVIIRDGETLWGGKVIQG